jgi:PAS domain S-box-containing protein
MIGPYTEAEIKKAREAIFETAVDIIYIFDVESLIILDMNEHGLNRLGYTLDEIRTLDFYSLHAYEEKERVAQIIDIYLREGTINDIRDLHLRRKDGSLVPVEKNGRITWINGKALGH